MVANSAGNTLLREYKMTNTLTDKFESLCEKIAEYESEKEKKIENNLEQIKLEHEAELRMIRKNIEDMQGKDLSSVKTMDRMTMQLELSDLRTELKLKELEIDDMLERAQEDFQRVFTAHKEKLEQIKTEIIEDAKECALYAEGAVKGNRDDQIGGATLETMIDTLDSDWKCLRERYGELITNQRNNIKIYSRQLEELNGQRARASAELEKCENEKNFLQGKIGLDIVDDESVTLDGGLKKIDAAKRNIAKIEREIKKANIRRDACKEKIDIIKTMIDEVIAEMVDEYFQMSDRAIPDYLRDVKFFGLR